MKILRFDPTHQRNDAHFQLHTEFRDQVIKETAGKLDINAEYQYDECGDSQVCGEASPPPSPRCTGKRAAGGGAK